MLGWDLVKSGRTTEPQRERSAEGRNTSSPLQRVAASGMSPVTAAMLSSPMSASSGALGRVVEEQVAGGDVEEFGEPDETSAEGANAAVLAAADLAGIARRSSRQGRPGTSRSPCAGAGRAGEAT